MDRTEIPYTDSRTGGSKNQKLARFDLIPEGPLIALAEHYGRGAAKYSDHNWRRGYPWSICYTALQRHLWLWWGGEELDPDPTMAGSHHLDAAAWHIFTLREFVEHQPQFDDRPPALRARMWQPDGGTP